MNAKDLLDHLHSLQNDGVQLQDLKVVVVFRPCVDWEELYPDEADGDVEHGEFRLISF